MGQACLNWNSEPDISHSFVSSLIQLGIRHNEWPSSALYWNPAMAVVSVRVKLCSNLIPLHQPQFHLLIVRPIFLSILTNQLLGSSKLAGPSFQTSNHLFSTTFTMIQRP